MNDVMTAAAPLLPPADARLADRFERAMQSRAADTAPSRAARNVLDARCLVGVGAVAFLLDIRGGRVIACRRGVPLLASWDFAVRGTPDAWEGLWRDPPAPGEHDLFALYKAGRVSIEGRLEPFLAHLQFFKDLLASPRFT
jgi:hypothetical protein